MTHTLHRKGNTLEKDLVVLTMSAKRINDEGSAPKLAESFEIMQKAGAVNLGDMKNGNVFCLTSEEITKSIRDQSIVHGVFTNKDDLLKAITVLKEANLGMSVVVSGLFEEVFEVTRKAGLQPHSVNISLGIWGRKDLLPTEEYLRLCTMCGHGMISPLLVKTLVDEVKRKQITIEDAVTKISKCCICGVFNPARAADLIEELTDL